VVYDTVNNITWLADANLAATNLFGLPLCSGSGSGLQTCINATGSMDYPSAAAWVAAMNAADYLGHSNWQLPRLRSRTATVRERGERRQFRIRLRGGALASVYNGLGFRSPNTAVPIPNTTAGPFRNLQPYLYWSSSNGASPENGNAAFSFTTGWIGANTLPNFLYLLPMIPGKIRERRPPLERDCR